VGRVSYAKIIDNPFAYASETRRLAEANTEAALEQAWQSTQDSFRRSWERRGHVLLFMIHDVDGEIDDEEVTSIVGTIGKLPKRTPIDIVIHTRGGWASSTSQIAAALLHRPNTAAFVPIFARSGGTKIALATRAIYLAKDAALGPIDLRLGYGSARDIMKIAEELGDGAPPEIRLAALEAKKELRDEVKKACELISPAHKGFLGWRGCTLAKTLTSGEMPHGRLIDYREAKRLGINVYSRMPKSIYELISIRSMQLKRLRELPPHATFIEQRASSNEEH